MQFAELLQTKIKKKARDCSLAFSSSLVELFKIINTMVCDFDSFFINAQFSFDFIQSFHGIVVKFNLVCQLFQFIFDNCKCGVVLFFGCLHCHLVLFISPFLLPRIIDHADQDGNSTSDNCFNHSFSSPQKFYAL